MTAPQDDRGAVHAIIDDLKALLARIEERLSNHQPRDNSRIHLGNAHIQVGNAITELGNHVNTLAPPPRAEDGEKQTIGQDDVANLDKAGLGDLAGKKQA